MNRKYRKIPVTIFFFIFLLSSLAFLHVVEGARVAAAAQDVITLKSKKGKPGKSVKIAVYVSDFGGTSLGVDQVVGNRIQGLALKVKFSHPEAISDAKFVRAGITGKLSPIYEKSIYSGDVVGYLASFNESPKPLKLKTQKKTTAKGNLIGNFVFSIASGASTEEDITLVLDSFGTALVNQAGTAGETVEGGELALRNGVIYFKKKPAGY